MLHLMLIPTLDGNNIRGKEGIVCVYKRMRMRNSKLWRMLSRLDLALGFFPLPAEMTVSVMWTKSSGQTKMKT